jgi:radical SAM superfamily enzyme YgiQ (UPF0313 family)
MQEQDFLNIPGVVCKNNGEIIKNDMVVPKYDVSDLIIADYSDFDRSRLSPNLLVSRTRGCSGTCEFCDEKEVFKGYQLMNNDRVMNEIKYFVEKYGMRTFKWADSTFTARELDTIKTCESLISEGLSDLKWLAYARVKEVLKYSDKTIQLMKDAGCYGLHFGFETFDKCVLTDTNKGYKTAQDAIFVVKKVRGHGIKVTGSFMNGFPGQDEESLWRSIENAIRLELDVYNIHAAVPPLKQMINPEKYNVNPMFRLWNNDPNIPANLFGEYTQWHIETYGIPDTLGRHTTSKELAIGLPARTNSSAYRLLYSNDVLVQSLEKFMGQGRESIEYDLMYRDGMRN